MKIKINKIDRLGCAWDNAPTRKHYNDAGADVKTAIGDCVMPHSTKRIPLGFSIELPDGYMACVFPRSGMSCKGIVCELPPIDSGYRGEVHAIVSNLTDEPVVIGKGTRIGQLVVMPVVLSEFVESLGEERGDGAFGSTGEK